MPTSRHRFRAQWHDYNGGVFFVTVDIPHYVIMPNHFHAIIYIDADNVGTQHVASAYKEVEEHSLGALKPKKHPDNDEIDVNHHYNSRLAVAVRSIKAAVTRYAKQNGCCFAWQGRFHDRIIRNQEELNLISEYIDNNALRWDTDCFKE